MLRRPLKDEPVKTSAVLSNGGVIMFGNNKTKAQTRIFCFCYNAGSAAMYKAMASTYSFVEICPVNYPGHGSRIEESLISDLPTLIENLAYDLFPCDKPFVFFGYSLGALIAYELSLYLKKHLNIEPKSIILAAEQSPNYIGELDFDLTSTEPNNTQLLKDYILNCGCFNIPKNTRENPERFEAALKVIRADLMIESSYKKIFKSEKVNSDVIVIWGKLDKGISKQQAEDWKNICEGKFQLIEIEGPHLFITESDDQFYKIMAPIFGQFA